MKTKLERTKIKRGNGPQRDKTSPVVQAPFSLFGAYGQRKYLTADERQRFMTVALDKSQPEQLFALRCYGQDAGYPKR